MRLNIGVYHTIIIIFILLIFPILPSMVSANITVFPAHSIVSSQGKIWTSNPDVYLESVNITIELYKDNIQGIGKYILNNPSNSTSDLNLFFDPSYYPKDCCIDVDGEMVDTWDEEVDESYYSTHNNAFFSWVDDSPYEVALFNVSIPPSERIEIQISWKTNSKVVTYKEANHPDGPGSDRYKLVDWGTTYLIISNRSWPRPIEDLNIKFISHHSKFDEAEVSMIASNNYYGDRISSDEYRIDKKFENGHSIVTISSSNWFKNDTMVIYDGEHERTEVKESSSSLILNAIVISIVILNLGIIILVGIKKRKKYRRKVGKY